MTARDHEEYRALRATIRETWNRADNHENHERKRHERHEKNQLFFFACFVPT